MLGKKHLKGVRDTSVKSVSKLIEVEQGAMPSRCASNQKFVPFLRERDAIGRLLKPRLLKVRKSKSNLNKNLLLPKIHIKQKLFKNNYKGDVPPIGAYNLGPSWIKKSFASKKLLSIGPSTPDTSFMKNALQKDPEVVKSKSIAVGRHKEISVPPRRKGVWEDIKVYDTPASINGALNFQEEFKEIMYRQLSISKSLEHLRSILYS